MSESNQYQSKCCLKPNKLSPDQLTLLEDEHLKPGYFCSGGFMSKNDRLLDIYNEDINTLANRDISTDQIADVLTNIIEKYKRKNALTGYNHYRDCAEYSPDIKKLHDEQLLRIGHDIFSLQCNDGYKISGNVKSTNPIVIDDRYLVTRHSFWGFQACPFICFSGNISRAVEGGGDDYWIYDLQTKKTLQFNDLLIHLIRDHHFFEGNVYHRLSPNDIIDFFNLQPGIDYSNDYVEVDRWVRLDEGGNNSPCYIFGETNGVNVTRKDANTLILECTQRDISQKDVGYISPEERKCIPNSLLERLALVKHEYVYYEMLVDGLPIRHRLDMKRVSTYIKKRVRYIPVEEETSYPKTYDSSAYPMYTILPQDKYMKVILINGEVKTKHVETDIFGNETFFVI